MFRIFGHALAPLSSSTDACQFCIFQLLGRLCRTIFCFHPTDTYKVERASNRVRGLGVAIKLTQVNVLSNKVVMEFYISRGIQQA